MEIQGQMETLELCVPCPLLLLLDLYQCKRLCFASHFYLVLVCILVQLRRFFTVINRIFLVDHTVADACAQGDSSRDCKMRVLSAGAGKLSVSSLQACDYLLKCRSRF